MTPHEGARVPTESAARRRITEYLTETLRALPPGAGLSRTPDNPSLGAFDDQDAAITVPCADDPRVGGDIQVQIRYWVVGVPPGRDERYFALIRDTWTHNGFALASGANAIWAPVITPAGYRLVVQNAGKGDGSLSITAGSPCFPSSPKAASTPQPGELRRPS